MPRRSPGPSVKNRDQYEALRRNGMSKQKAARIANTPARTASRRRVRSEPYEDWSKDQLYKKAKQVGIEGRSNMNKGQLVRALRRGS
jgi:hypothetical protein